MPSLEWNRRNWDGAHNWSLDGDEWSIAWGDADMQWRGTIAPRLRGHLPADRIVEIGPGYGRWTARLGECCNSLIGVDISERCINRCHARFADRPHMTFHVGNGNSLPMVEDGSADLVFSFDSLVHAELDVLRCYLAELGRVLSDRGTAFLHHSNLGAFPLYFRAVKSAKAALQGGSMTDAAEPSAEAIDGSSATTVPPRDTPREQGGAAIGALRRGLWLDSDRSRALSVTADAVVEEARRVGLSRLSQEIINWGTRRTIDCITILGRAEAGFPDRGRRINGRFMEEAAALRRVAALYPLSATERSRL